MLGRGGFVSSGTISSEYRDQLVNQDVNLGDVGFNPWLIELILRENDQNESRQAQSVPVAVPSTVSNGSSASGEEYPHMVPFFTKKDWMEATNIICFTVCCMCL